jgi:uncharacterized protein YdhG (YjbR/CyaY superfamily)
MRIEANNVLEYINKIAEDKKNAFVTLREVIINNIPPDFKEEMSYGMVGYVVPHDIYPAGYHCDPKLPLPFVSIAAQKNFIGFYHMGIYANPELYKWFVEEYSKHCKYKLDMGKSCVRLKKMEDIPYDLIGELMTKMTAQDWIDMYEENYKK